MPTKKIAKKTVNHVAIVVDKSGSMQSISEPTRKALNKTFDDLAANSKRTGQTTFVSLYEFGSMVKTSYTERPIVAVLPEYDYHTNMGMTALFDATGKAIEGLLSVDTDPKKNEAFLVIVLTDGGENESRAYDQVKLNRLIQKVHGTDKWTLTFLLPPGHKSTFCRNFSVPEGNVAEWEGTARGAETAGILRSQGLDSYFTSRSTGATKSLSFYTTDASHITKRDLSRKLDDIKADVKVWNVDKEIDIQSFVEAKTKRPYRKGTGFYQLSKTEKNIQGYKEILLIKKGEASVYAGDQARTLLGLPIGVDAKVEPGNHANFDIFIQSTSNNRKLVRGTKFIYNPAVA